jgi:hypothetical protein
MSGPSLADDETVDSHGETAWHQEDESTLASLHPRGSCGRPCLPGIKEGNEMRHGTLSEFLTNLDQSMPLSQKLTKLTRNLW